LEIRTKSIQVYFSRKWDRRISSGVYTRHGAELGAHLGFPMY